MVVHDEFTKCETNVRLDGKVALVTGATSGLGLEVAKNLGKRGARVIMAGRNLNKLAAAKETVIRSSRNNNVKTGFMDYVSLTSVRSFAQEILTTESRLDILVNNIGTFGLQDKLSEDGLQLTMQVNYFGQFLLTFLLYPLLKASSPSRVINIVSLAVLLGYLDLDHFNDVGRYGPVRSYCNSKLADLLFTVEMDRRVRDSGVSVYSLDPGAVKTNLFGSIKDEKWRFVLNAGLRKFGSPVERVARLPIYLAVEPSLESSSGKHFRDCAEFYSSWFVSDTALTKQLWIKSKNIVSVKYEEDWEIHLNNSGKM